MNSIFRETFRVWKKPILWVFFWVVLFLAYLALFSPIGEVGRLVLPESLAQDLGQPAGWIGRLGFALAFPLLLAGFSAWMGSRLIADEMESGTLSLLLAQPITRSKLLFAKILAMLASVGTLVIGLGLLVILANWILGLDIRLDNLPLALVGLMLFALLYGFLGLALGCLTGSRRISRWVTWLLLLLALGLALLDYLPSAWIGWPYFSPLYALSMQNPLSVGIQTLPLLLLAGLVLVAFLFTWVIFEQRDLEI